MAKKQESDSIIDMFARLGEDMNVPKVDIERVLEHHRKNLEAFEKSARAASAGAASIMSGQREFMKQAMADITDIVETMRVSRDPKEVMAKQVEITRRSFETAVKNTGEAAELVKKSGDEALEVLRARIREGMEEVRDGFGKRG